MNIRRVLGAIFREIAEEAERNPEFKVRLQTAIGTDANPKRTKTQPKNQNEKAATGAVDKRPSNRRAPAVLDPVHLARQSEEALRAKLRELEIEQLRDIVAEYGMDTGKLVMKWRDAHRVIDRIVDVARSRAQKGSAFRDQITTEPSVDEKKSQ